MSKYKHLAIVAFAVAGLAGLTSGCATPFPTTAGGPPATSSGAPVSPTPSTAASTASPSAPPPAAPCTAAMLGYDSKRTGGAAGTAYSTYTFHNRGSVSCRASGYPQLDYVDGHGVTLPVPVTHDPATAAVTVAPGGKVQFVAHEINGYGGYETSAPQCAHPATYNHVVVALPGGSVSLGADGTMSVQCGSITVGSWTPPGA